MGLVLLDCLVNSVTGIPLSVSCLVVLALQKKPCYGVKCNCRECLRYNLPQSHNRSIAMSSGEFLGMTPAILNRIEFAVGTVGIYADLLLESRTEQHSLYPLLSWQRRHIAVVSVLTANFTDTVFGRQLAEVESKVSKLGVPYTFICLPSLKFLGHHRQTRCHLLSCRPRKTIHISRRRRCSKCRGSHFSQPFKLRQQDCQNQ